MARLKLKQVLSNLHYNENLDQLILSGSKIPTANSNYEEIDVNWEDTFGNWDGTRNGIPDFVIYGGTFVTASAYATGSIAVEGTVIVSGSFQTGSL